MRTEDGYDRLCQALRRQADLAAALRLLQWDQETGLPPAAAAGRARQIGALASLLHAQQTDAAFLALVDTLSERLPELAPAQAVDVRETRWRLDRKRALDPELVRERSELHARTRSVWVEARRDDDFARIVPDLEAIVALEIRVASAIDADRAAYDVLLEGYEPGATAADLVQLFDGLRAGLRPLVARLDPQADGGLAGPFPLEAQRRFNRAAAEAIGFDFSRGRLDEAAHPFTTTVGDDVRITTRYDEADLGYALFSTLHEAGHGLYEQGLDPEARGLPRGTACSLGVHESQSRLWENQVGRSHAYWQHTLPTARSLFPALADVSLDAVLRSANRAGPSLIRTEADEITYNLHVALRFDLERGLVDGSLRAADLPEAWRAGMRADLGIVPEHDREGVLQDVHWFSGAIGYFPTYTLGNLYAAQLLEAARDALGDLDPAFAAGDFAPLLRWLRERIHRRGQWQRGAGLIESATGQPPSPRPLLTHLAGVVERFAA